MKTICAFFLIAAFAVPPGAFAQKAHRHDGPDHGMPMMSLKGSGGWGMGGKYAPLWDAKTVTTVKGKVVSVIHLMPGEHNAHGIQIKVDTGAEQLLVHLGPLWFLENQDYEVKEGDAVEAVGSRVEYNDRPALIAKSIAKGDMTLRLRDDNGIPFWAAWRKK